MPDPLNSGPVGTWDRFFFRPADPTPLGLMRIVVGLLLLWSLGSLGLDLAGFLGSRGWVDPDLIRMERTELDLWEWSAWLLVPDAALWPAWCLAMTALALFTVGMWTRVTSVLAWVVVVSTARRAPAILFGFDQMVSIWTFYLAATGAGGQALSLDRWIATGRKRWGRASLVVGGPPTVSANLARRLIQIQLCVIYLAAGLAKVRGASWWDGTALIKLLANDEFRPWDLTGVLAWPGAIYALNLAALVAMFLELGYSALIWVRPLRPWVVAAALVMHLGIALTLGLWEFSAAMAAGNLAFLDGPSLRRRLTGRVGSTPLGPLV